jgi:hypothetical protein
MLKFSSALGLDLATTADITLMDPIIRTGPITGRIMALPIGRIIGMADTDITATIVTTTTTIGTRLAE